MFSLIEYNIVEREKLYCFDNYKKYPFLELKFNDYKAFQTYSRFIKRLQDILYFRFVKGISRHQLREKNKRLKADLMLNVVPPDSTYFENYETNINPMLRFLHDKDLNASGWVGITKYDNLKDIFTIYYNNGDKSIVEVDDLAEAKSLASSVNDLTMVTQNVLNPGKEYYITYEVEIKADTKNTRLPLYLDYFFNLFPGRGSKSEKETTKPVNQ